MKNELQTIDSQNLQNKIHSIRGFAVILDRDLAELYEVETKRINEAVRNNQDKFLNDFYFELSDSEFENLRSKLSTTNFSKTRTNPKVFEALEDKSFKPKEGIFFDGQIYDAYAFVNDLLKSAKSEVVLIDNYIDDTVFTLFSKYLHVKIKIYTQTISKQLNLDYQKYQSQYKNIELKEFKKAHDRFLIIDQKEIYHIGASLKDLGKKWFAFSKFDIDTFKILSRLKNE
jgi:hypothetical protein